MAYSPGSITAASVVAWADEAISLPTDPAELEWFETVIAHVETMVLRDYYNMGATDENGIKLAIAKQSARFWHSRNAMTEGEVGVDGFRPLIPKGIDRDLQWLLRKKVVFA